MQNGIDADPDRAALISMEQPPNHLARLVGPGPVQSPATRGPDEILTWSYAQMQRGAARLATVLAQHHVPAESVILTYVPQSVEWVLLLWASALARLTVLNRMPGEAEKEPELLRSYLSTLAPAVVVVEDEAAVQVVDQIRREVLALGEELEAPFLGISLGPLSAPRRGWVSMADIADTAFTESESTVDAAAVQAQDRPDRVAQIFYTSGSSGKPKGVPRTVKNLCAFVAATGARACVGIVFGGNFAAMNGTMPLLMANTGSTLVLSGHAFSWDGIMRAIETCHVSAIALLRSHVSLLSQHASFSPERVKSLRRVAIGSEIVTHGFLEKTRAMFPNAGIFPGFGMTEGMGLFTWPLGPPGPLPNHMGVVSIGKLSPGARARIITENGDMAACGEQGELHVSGDGVSERYLDDCGESSVFYKDEFGTWFRTGDIAVMDESNWVYVVGRLKDRLKSAEGLFHPFEIEPCITDQFGVEVSIPSSGCWT
jgi:acyl-CoA synthetase (AMP-forming)/AMP-acid ligase II